MNQKDYKEIARIIKEYTSEFCDRPVIYSLEKFKKELADYFESQDDRDLDKGMKNWFNKKQFLKSCGLEVKE